MSSPEPGLQAANPSPPCDQSQSPLFAKLPLDIRRQIYLQLWLDSGLTQHIYTFNEQTYLRSFPCILGPSEWDRDPRPGPEESSPQLPPDVQLPADDLQPQPQDDPGDINGAIQDISPGPEVPGDVNGHRDTPWCFHKLCFDHWIEKWDQLFSWAFSANYRGSSYLCGINTPSMCQRSDDRLRKSPLLLPLMVCRRMYQEAGESMFSNIRFSFPKAFVLGRFLEDVPSMLTGRIQYLDVLIYASRFFRAPPSHKSQLQVVCKMIQDSFPNVRELRLTLHPTRPLAPLPPLETLGPLYDVARGLENLRKFDVKLPCVCGEESPVGYGGTPDYLKDAPFTAALVPPGWHENKCVYYVSL